MMAQSFLESLGYLLRQGILYELAGAVASADRSSKRLFSIALTTPSFEDKPKQWR